MKKNVRLSKEQIAEKLVEIFNMIDSKPRISRDGNVRINMDDLSIDCMIKLVDLKNEYYGLIPLVKRSGTGIVVLIKDLQL